MQKRRACDLDAGQVPRSRYQPGLIGLRWCLARKVTLGLRAFFACQRTESWFRDEEALELEQGVTFAGIVSPGAEEERSSMAGQRHVSVSDVIFSALHGIMGHGHGHLFAEAAAILRDFSQ